MEKLNTNELLTCNGGNILTVCSSLFFNVVYALKKLKVVFGGRR